MQEAVLLGEALVEGGADVQFTGADVGNLSIEREDQLLPIKAGADALFNVRSEGGRGSSS